MPERFTEEHVIETMASVAVPRRVWSRVIAGGPAASPRRRRLLMIPALSPVGLAMSVLAASAVVAAGVTGVVLHGQTGSPHGAPVSPPAVVTPAPVPTPTHALTGVTRAPRPATPAATPAPTPTPPAAVSPVPARTPTPVATPAATPVATPSPVPPGPNEIDAADAGFETSLGTWAMWYSTTVTRTNAVAHSGQYSLGVTVTQNSNNWGVSSNNWAGFASSPGAKTMSFWALLGSGSNVSATMTIQWIAADHATELGRSSASISSLGHSWQAGTAHVTAPPGTAFAFVSVAGSGYQGTSLYLDDFSISP